MKRILVVLGCTLFLSAAAPISSAGTDIRIWPHHHKDPGKTTAAAKPKSERTFLHRAHPTREEAARAETAYGMTGPKSVGFWHPMPGPAGVGAK
jgi:hypothetical protein